jgi:hypothetical protein
LDVGDSYDRCWTQIIKAKRLHILYGDRSATLHVYAVWHGFGRFYDHRFSA